MNIALLIGLGISIIGSISILLDNDTNVKEIEKESTDQKIYFTDSN